MDAELDTLWALVAGILLLLATVGAVVLSEGMTRRRSVLTVSSRHLAGAAGAVIGLVALASVDSALLPTTAASGLALEPTAQLWLAACSGVLLTSLAMAGMAERATVVAHLLGGVLIGGALAPLAASGRHADGFLTTIEFGDRGFVDTAAGSMFAVAGWVALVGAMIIGPRRGRSGREGSVRDIPGKSMPLATVGALIMYSTLIGVLGRPGEAWGNEIIDGATVMLMGGAVGVLVGIVIGRAIAGDVRVIHVLRGLLAGVVSTTGDPLGASLEEAAIAGAVGAVIALVVGYYIDSVNIDDPVGIISVFGAAGVWGTLAVGVANSDQFLAQFVGTFVVASITTIAAGALFSMLRLLRVFRVRSDIEIAGLEP